MSSLVSEEKEYVSLYIPKSLAKQLKDIQNGEETNKVILKYIEAVKNDIRLNAETFEPEILSFRAAIAKAKQEFEKAKNEEIDTFEAIWDNYDKQISEIKNKIKVLKETVEPLKKEMNELNKSLSALSIYGVDNLLTLIQKVQTLSENDAKALSFFIENYKR
jgi:uncharacterized coiled-coil DUF342 family protein